MALADYYLCDLCHSKAFYDANIFDSSYTGEDDDIPQVAMMVLCPDCAQTHEIIIKERT